MRGDKRARKFSSSGETVPKLHITSKSVMQGVAALLRQTKVRKPSLCERGGRSEIHHCSREQTGQKPSQMRWRGHQNVPQMDTRKVMDTTAPEQCPPPHVTHAPSTP